MKLIDGSGLRVAVGFLALGMPVLSVAGGLVSLNQVWSRMADIYGELGSVESAEFSPDSEFIVTGSKFDFTVRMWRTADGTQVWVRKVPQEIERVAFTRDGKYVVAGSEDFMLRVLDASNGEIVFEYEHENGIDGLAASHDGRYMVSGQESVNGVGTGRVFDTQTWKVVETLSKPGTLNEIDFTPDDRYMAAAGQKSTRIWRVSDWSLHHEFLLDGSRYFEDRNLGFINCKFSPDGQVLAVGGTQGYVYLYDVASGDLLRLLNKTGQKTETVEWTQDGRYLLVAGHGSTIDFYRSEQLLDESLGNDSVPFALRAPVSDNLEYMEFNSTGTLFTSAHQDGTVQLWTYMSDDPSINARRHREIRQQQDQEAAQRSSE